MPHEKNNKNLVLGVGCNEYWSVLLPLPIPIPGVSKGILSGGKRTKMFFVLMSFYYLQKQKKKKEEHIRKSLINH